MEMVKKYQISTLRQKLIGKTVNFKSDCQLFPNFDVTGRVVEISLSGRIPLINVITKNGRKIHIDGGMSNLSFTILNI